MIIELNKKNKHGIEILSLFPVSEIEEEEYPVGMFFTHEGRKYVAYADDGNLEDAALKSLQENRIKYEELYDATKIAVLTIMATGRDFHGTKKHREAYAEDAGVPWPKAVCDIMHDIVRYRLHRFFHYGDGYGELCIYMDILTKISFPFREASAPL